MPPGQEDSRHSSAVMAVFLDWAEVSRPHLVRTAVEIVAHRFSVDESQIKLARWPRTQIWRQFKRKTPHRGHWRVSLGFLNMTTENQSPAMWSRLKLVDQKSCRCTSTILAFVEALRRAECFIYTRSHHLKAFHIPTSQNRCLANIKMFTLR